MRRALRDNVYIDIARLALCIAFLLCAVALMHAPAHAQQAEGAGSFWELSFDDITEDKADDSAVALPVDDPMQVPAALSAGGGASPFPMIIYAAIFILVGVTLSLMIYLSFRRQVDVFFDRITGHRPSKKLSDAHVESVLDRVYGYYYASFDQDTEWLSPLLRTMLRIDDFSTGFSTIAQAFEAESSEKLSQMVTTLKRGDVAVQSHILQIKQTGAYVDCIGVLSEEAGQPNGYALWFRDVSERERTQRQQHDENTAIRQQYRVMQQLLDSAPFPVWHRDTSLNITYCNNAFAEVVEKTTEDIVGNHDTELDKDVREMAEKAKGSGKVQQGDRHIVVSGERKLFHVIEQPLYANGNRSSEAGEPQAFSGYAYDLSAKEDIAAELSRMIAAQADFLESSASAMAIYGPDMRLKSFNQAFVRLWNLEESWLDEQPAYGDVLEALREKRKLPEQANFPVFKKQNTEMFTKLIKAHEEFYYLPDGTVLRVIVIPHSLGGLLFAYEDVTDRLALERNYNTLIAVQRASLDHLHEGVAVFSENGRLKLFNPEYARLWHVDAKQLSDEPHMSDIIEEARALFKIEEDWTTYKERAINVLTSRETHNGRLHRTDGTVLDWRSVPLPDGAAMIAYYDVTDSILVEQTLLDKNKALEEADRIKTEFLASMSYELRSPLTSIMGFSEALTHHYFGELNTKQGEYVEAIHASSRKLMALINDILDLASIEAGYLSLTMTEFDIQEFLASVLEMQEERARDASLTLRVECDERVGIIAADEARLKQVMFNLLHNAVKFTPPGGSIVLGAAARSESGREGVDIWVEDTGVGIPEDEQESVFKRFYKAKVSSSRGHKSGAGLGLSMVKRFIALHGGSVTLTSEPGKGTRITCHLLRSVPDELTLPREGAAAPQHRPQAAMKQA